MNNDSDLEMRLKIICVLQSCDFLVVFRAYEVYIEFGFEEREWGI